MKYLRLFLCLVAFSLTACMSHLFVDTTTRLQVENKTDVTILGLDIISEDGKSVQPWIRDAIEPGEKSKVVEEDWVGTFKVRVRFDKWDKYDKMYLEACEAKPVRVKEEAKIVQKDVMTVLQEGNAALKKLQEEVNIEKLQAIKDEMDDLKEKNDEISEFFKERGIDDTEDVDDELNKLIATVQQEAEGELPSANKEKLEEEKENEKEEEKNKKVAVEA